MRYGKLLDYLGLLLFFSFFVAWIFRMRESAISLSAGVLLLLVCLGLGLALADLLSGITHWAADRYGNIDLPILGPHFLFPFRAHHLHPKDMVKLGFVENNGNACLVSGTFYAIAFFLLPPIGSSLSLFFLTALVFFLGLFTGITNLFHRWAHASDPPALALFLQKKGIILSPEHHSIHHTSPFAQHYCITCGWLNPLLDRIGFFEKLEKAIFRWTGAKAGDYDLQEIAEKYERQMRDYFKNP